MRDNLCSTSWSAQARDAAYQLKRFLPQAPLVFILTNVATTSCTWLPLFIAGKAVRKLHGGTTGAAAFSRQICSQAVVLLAEVVG